MSVKNLLIELLVEELPPKALNKLGESFSNSLFDSLKAQGLTTENSAENSMVTAYATPRRLAAHITQVAEKAADKQISQKLMPANVGLDANGNASPALLKKLQALGADESVVSTLKNENNLLFLDVLQAGATLKDALQKAFEEALAKLPIPKVMTYQLNDGWSSVNFVRPAHGLVALHGEAIINVGVLGLNAGNTTQGHRFEAKQPVITIKNADSYEQQLLDDGAVIASFAARKAEIANQLNAAAGKQNLKPIKDDALLDEVTALVERPNVLLGQFEEIYLEVPQECLILTMKANQKYFPLLDANDKLTNKFLIVSNINPADPSAVIGGNERVVRPRLADAKFFFDQDLKKELSGSVLAMDKIVYHHKLGTMFDRVQRIESIAVFIADQFNDDELRSRVRVAATICKNDLLSNMVAEFPELQGIMGRYYAQHYKMHNDIAFAIEDHYKPRFAGDGLPRSLVGICVALADKLETLVGLFSAGEKPTGDKDPFGLRRQALGVLRLLIECQFPLTFSDLVQNVLRLCGFEDNINTIDAIKEFCYDRLNVSLREQGASAQEVDAVLSINPEILSDIPQFLSAVRTFSTLDEAPALAAANKRVSNILKKVEGEVKAEVNANLLQEPAEIALNKALSIVKPEADELFESGDYTGSLKALAALKAPVDDFFDNVMVNADKAELKANRLGLLAILHQTMNRVADLSKLAS